MAESATRRTTKPRSTCAVRRAEIVVAIGEQFVDHDDPGSVIPASLESSRDAVLLTVVRAFSQVTAVELSLR